MILFLLLEPIYSLKWPFSSSSSTLVRDSGPLESSGINELSISQLEKDTVFQNLDLAATFKPNSDCFRDVIGNLDSRCEDMENSQEDRVDAAISMAICELQTTEHAPVPMECNPSVKSWYSTVHSSKSCVEALYRSPQLWSSYSGYLRQIPQLCFAYRRWHDIDTAKRIYQNATFEKVSLLKMLKRHHEELLERESAFSGNLENLASIGAKLGLAANLFDVKANHVLDDLRHSWSEERKEIDSSHRNFHKLIHEQVQAHGNELSAVAHRTAEQHAAALQALLKDTSHSLNLVRDSLDGLSSHAGSLSVITRDAQGEWPKLQAGLVTFANVLTTVNGAMEHISTKMQFQVNMMNELTSKQEHLSRQLASLSLSMAEISATAMVHMQDINETALSMKQGLLHPNNVSILGWILQRFTHVMPLFHLVDMYSLQTVSRPATWLFVCILRLAWSCLSPVLSFLASAFLVLLSRRFFSRTPIGSTWSRPYKLWNIFGATSTASSKGIAKDTGRAARVTFSTDPISSQRPGPPRLRTSGLSSRAMSAPPSGPL